HAGRALGVAEVALDGADRDRTRARAGGVAAGAADRLKLGGVADRGAGAVALEVADGLDAEARGGVGATDRASVAGGFRAGDAALSVRALPPAGDGCVA